MAVTADWFTALNSPVSFAGNRQLLLDSEDSVWIVTEGIVHVFAARLDGEANPGRRHYVSQFEPGDLLFGVPPYLDEGNRIAFLCAGIADAGLCRIDLPELQKALQDAAKAEQIVNCAQKWATLLTESLLDLGCDPEWEDKPTFSSDNLMAKLQIFNENAIKKAAKYIEAVDSEERLQIKDRQLNDQVFVDDSLKRLAEVSQPGKQRRKVIKDRAEYAANPFVAACQMVGEAMGISVKVPPQAILKQSRNILLDVVRFSQIRLRPIILAGNWWQSDNGPFLAFWGENRAPVALLPLTESRYKLVNPADGSEKAVDSATALKINPKAFMFYSVLPNKTLHLIDLLKFCSRGPIKKDLLLVMLIGILGGILNMLLPIANGILFDDIIPEGEAGQLLQMALILSSFGISGVLFQLTRTFAMLRIEYKTDTLVQAALWDRVLSLPAPFFRQFTAGELAMRTLGINQIRKVISGTVITTILSAIFSVFNLGLLFKYSLRMAWYALALICVWLAVTFICGLWQLRSKRELVKVTNNISGQVLQMIGGIAKFRVAGAEKRAFFQWTKAFGKQRKIEFQNGVVENIFTAFNAIFPVIASVIVFCAAFSTQNLAPGNFIAFNSAFSSLIAVMLALSGVILTVNNIIPTYESIRPILRTLPEYDDIKEDPGELDGSIELSHITFRYQPDAPAVINDLSLKINKGEYLAIVGASGCGKSTLLRLLLGFEKPESGKIYYGSHDLDKVDVRSIRRQLGVVMQNAQVISGDIRSNIIGTNPNLTMDDAIAAAKMAGLYEDIEAMPMGMFTLVSEGGSTLSGGQRQRLLIARVLAGKPKIIFFDEATSALDNKTQAIISKSMDSLKATRVVIAHRLSTIINCDRIVVIDKGRIIEEGSYAELMQNRRLFYEFAKRQLA